MQGNNRKEGESVLKYWNVASWKKKGYKKFSLLLGTCYIKWTMDYEILRIWNMKGALGYKRGI